ncbi:hypothetical protein TURU_036833 [Turdus rufiventris]|nr:hypothetical protein TURU_036833 [Turdus rufiventris]
MKMRFIIQCGSYMDEELNVADTRKCGLQSGQTNQVAKEAANRWTDNIFSIKSWAKRKFGFEESRIDKCFGIPEDLDYID